MHCNSVSLHAAVLQTRNNNKVLVLRLNMYRTVCAITPALVFISLQQHDKPKYDINQCLNHSVESAPEATIN